MNTYYRYLLRSRVLCLGFIFLLSLTPLCSQDAVKAVEPGSFRAGALSFVFPAPSSDLVETGSDYRVLLEPLAPASNRLVAAFILPDDLARLASGKRGAMTQYALVEVPRQAEFAEVSPEIFKQIVDGMATQFGAELESKMKESVEDTNRRLKALNSSAASVSADKPVYLGMLFSKSEACGVGATVALSSNGVSVKMVMGLAVVRVKNRVFFAYLYKRYEDESTLLGIRKTTEQWADSILSANKQ
jgi:hypothetical protein